ncbi:ADR123Wp [Eremothecium gossypii ATCC 10895]|uniref:Peptide hydrolase n=1 Tax=Eremothecium gossypii (strain ATCC 10895 / CBS 109.51 / FGSC 9923 / NRRL Y-1056) TaxID=284811 RepID=Q75A00_EREGS|nr:ADR123Wp [Eremothecium gossypii ATCC 10895]AAS52043.1 ADR123Wp [Eremothecium gossypii ATCC 10895]AEY96343.1 FADR123Wp [Eremothecium gossypii FDAG1]
MKYFKLVLTAGACAQAFLVPERWADAMAEAIAPVARNPLLFNEEPKLVPDLFRQDKPLVSSEKLQEMITVGQLNSSAWELYRIATMSTPEYGHPTRVIGSAGHNGTVEYILEELGKLGDYYDVSVQNFGALVGELRSYNLTYMNDTEVPWSNVLHYSPSVELFQGKLLHVPNLGCDEDDYRALVVGANEIALIERGECEFRRKSILAGTFGFKAAIIYNNDPEEGGISGTLGNPDEHMISTFGVSYDVGNSLVAAISLDPTFSLNAMVDSTVKEITTQNVIADTKGGDPENIVSLGAHSDSVFAGPGINDDGSGTISLLTVAKHLANFSVKNKVRFAWWSAEEEGLLGSEYYVSQLSPEENQKIRLFMDYDMMASPNYEYEVYDANNRENPAGSEELKNLYIDYYTSHGLNYTLVPFDGRSDYVAFIQNGIPGGGVATGAEKINALNNDPFDKCYHQLCDDTGNLNFEAFMVNTKLIAHAVATYGASLEDYPLRSTDGLMTLAATTQSPRFHYKGNSLIY